MFLWSTSRALSYTDLALKLDIKPNKSTVKNTEADQTLYSLIRV